MTPPLSRDGLARLDDVAIRHIASGDVPGLVALVAHGDDVHVVADGVMAIGGAPMSRDTLFRIASMTKPITAAATLALAREGLVGIDDSIEELLPELATRSVLRGVTSELDDTDPAQRAITVRDLLTFTFGFGVTLDMFSMPVTPPIVLAERELHLHSLGPPDPGRQPATDAWMAALGSLPLIAQPGERWLYNTGASVLGVLLARAAGTDLETVYRTRILEPLGMHDTAMWARDTSRLATAYTPSDVGLKVWDEPAGEWSHAPSFPDGAAGLVSTVDDLLAFARLLLRRGEPLLAAALVDEMTTDQLTPAQRAMEGGAILQGRGWGFCQAVDIVGERVGAFGWDGGFGSTMLIDPSSGLVVIVLTQRLFTSPTPPPVHPELQAAAFAALSDQGR